MVVTDWKLNKQDLKYLIVLLIFALVTIFFRTEYHMSGGVFSPDKALYLLNALKYSGLDYYNIVNVNDLYLSPIISFLTSLLFRLNLVDQLAISLVSSFFALIGYFGLYFLLRNRFNSLLSLTGVIIYGSITEFLLNLSSGLLDVPGISISIWILLLAIIAIDRNPKYFIWVFPVFTIGFFTRYTVGFILPVVLFYYILKRNMLDNILLLIEDKNLFKEKLIGYLKSDEFKYIIISIFLGIILTLLIIKFLILDFGGSLTFIEQSRLTTNISNVSPSAIDFSDDKLFYIKNLSEFLFSEKRALDTTFSYSLYIILIIGALIKFTGFIKQVNITYLKENIKTKKNLLLLTIVLISFLGFCVGFKIYKNHMTTNILLLIFLIVLYSLINNILINKTNKYELIFLFFAYLSINLIFISLYPIKVLRYALPLLPPLIFFIVLGLEGILDFIKHAEMKSNLSNESKEKFLNLIPIIIILVFMVSTFTFIEPMKIDGYSNSLVDASEYISSHDPDYHFKTYATNNHNYRLVKWDLRVNITNIFDELNEESDDTNVTYIIDWQKHKFDNYHKIYSNKYYYIYEHD